MQETRTQTLERVMRRKKANRSTEHWGPPGSSLSGPLTDEERDARPFCDGRVRALYGRRGKPARWYRAGWLCDGCGVFDRDEEG